MNCLEYFKMLLPFGISLRISRLTFSIVPFSQEWYWWQKYILILKIFSSFLWCLKRISLSAVMVFHSGNLFLIRRSARWISGIETGKIFSKNGSLDFLSTTTRSIPLPLLPERIKSVSASPILFLVLICLGLLSMKVRSDSFSDFGLRYLLLLFFLFLYASILLPYGLSMYR